MFNQGLIGKNCKSILLYLLKNFREHKLQQQQQQQNILIEYSRNLKEIF